jgi:hypothetical protein
MQEIFRTQDLVEISLIKSLLGSAGIQYFVFGEHFNSMIGGLGLIDDDMLACRFMVLDHDYDNALDLLEDAGLFDDD